MAWCVRQLLNALMYWLIRFVHHHNVHASADILELLAQVKLKFTTRVPKTYLTIGTYNHNLYHKCDQISIYMIQKNKVSFNAELITQ